MADVVKDLLILICDNHQVASLNITKPNSIERLSYYMIFLWYLPSRKRKYSSLPELFVCAKTESDHISPVPSSAANDEDSSVVYFP